MTTFIFKDIIDEFEKKMTARNQKAIIVLDNFSGHLIDFSQYKNVSAVFLKPLTTALMQPQDQGMYQTIKARFVKYRRSFVAEFDKYPTQSQVYQKVANLTSELSRELVTATWKMAGLSQMNNTQEEEEEV